MSDHPNIWIRLLEDSREANSLERLIKSLDPQKNKVNIAYAQDELQLIEAMWKPFCKGWKFTKLK